MIEANLEQESERLQPLLNYHRFASGNLNSEVGLQNYIQEVIVDEADDVDWYENAFNDPELNDFENNDDWFNVDILDFGYSKSSDDVPISLFDGSNHTGRFSKIYIIIQKS